MLEQILKNKSLTELSIQQQEIVVGGLQNIEKAVGSFYNTDAVSLLNQNGSGPGGSFVNTGIDEAQLNTGSNELLNANFC